MDLPSKAYTLRKEISILEHDLEIWELTRCAESRQAVLRAVAAIADALDRMVVDLAAHDPPPKRLALRSSALPVDRAGRGDETAGRTASPSLNQPLRP
jgi:hypothetical protein